MLACVVLGAAWLPRPAAAQDVMAAVRADQWTQAATLAAQYPDPVAGKLVTYLRLLAPGAASVGEIDAFIAQNPDWPAQASLARRRDEALAGEADETVVMALCARTPPHLAGTLLRCATALSNAGQAGPATDLARQAWREGLADTAAEVAFLQRWGGMMGPAEHWARFDHLVWSDPAAAARQIPRLDVARRPVAEARLALRRDDPIGPALLAALPAPAQADPSLFYDRARFLRHTGDDDAALALWKASGDDAQRQAGPDHAAAFWAERNLLARRRLQTNDAAGAYALVRDHGQTAGEPLLEAEFLAGFIALRRLHDPAAAAAHFQTLARASKAAITQGRAHYWLGRAAAAAGGDAKPEYRLAAAWPTTFYGQLAALALGEDAAALGARITALHDPTWDREQVLAFAGREVTRATTFLVAWGEARRAHAFLLQLDELAPDDADRALAARFATGLGMPDQAVAIARRAGRDGLMLAESGWPMPVDPPAEPAGEPVEPATTLGLIRQESSFDAAAVSPSGARGLMQLMPATAASVARQIGAPTSLAALTSDPGANMRLGVAYLRSLLDQFGNTLPLAIAAYNAGPNRVQEWLAQNGDPRLAGVGDQPDMVDWIELIPFNETRNYVQRVTENIVLYRARLQAKGGGGGATPHPLAAWVDPAAPRTAHP